MSSILSCRASRSMTRWSSEKRIPFVLPWMQAALKLQNNSALAAAQAFIEKTGIAGAHISIEKRIPMQAGLGGASADAAAVLIGLDNLYEQTFRKTLAALGKRIGVRILRFALTGGTARVRGIGENISPLFPSAFMHYAVVKPYAGVPTREAANTKNLCRYAWDLWNMPF